MIDFKKYFELEHQFFLEDIRFNRIPDNGMDQEIQLNCLDTVDTQLQHDRKLKLTFNRCLNFEPNNLFNLSVTFGAILTFNPEIDIDNLKDINFSQEIIISENTVLGNLVSRSSLLISQITASFGQQPIITPPTITQIPNNPNPH